MTYRIKRPDGDTKWWETSHDEEKLKHVPAHDNIPEQTEDEDDILKNGELSEETEH